MIDIASVLPPFIYFESIKRSINPTLIESINVYPEHINEVDPKDPTLRPQVREWRVLLSMVSKEVFTLKGNEARAFAEALKAVTKSLVIEQIPTDYIRSPDL